MKKFLLPVLFVLIFLDAAPAEARQTHIPDEYPSIGRSTRALGMGNAFLTMRGDDESPLYYNPASLNDLKRDTKTVANIPPLINADFNYKIISTVKDIFDLKNDISDAATKADKIAKFNEFVGRHGGQFNHVAIKIPYVTIYRHNWGIGLIGDSRTTVALRNNLGISNFELRSVNDAGVVLGGAYGFFFDDLQVGARIKLLERAEIDKIVTVHDIEINDSLLDVLGWSKWQKGVGVGGDIGVKYTIPFLIVDPTVAVTYTNIGNMRFTGHPNDVDQSVNAAVGIHPDIGSVGTSVEVGAVGINQKQDFLRKLHAGTEVRLPKLAATKISLRAGVNQGYSTGGLTLDWGLFKMIGAFYGEETGQYRYSKATYRYGADFLWVF